MDYNLNSFYSDLFPIMMGNDKIKSFLTEEVNFTDDQELSQLSNQFVDFHSRAEKEIVQVFQDLPDIPVHNSYNTTETYGLPLLEKETDDIQSKSKSYQLQLWTETERALKKYYQDCLRNKNIPDVYRELIVRQLDEFTELMVKLDTANSIQE